MTSQGQDIHCAGEKGGYCIEVILAGRGAGTVLVPQWRTESFAVTEGSRVFEESGSRARRCRPLRRGPGGH